MDNKTTCLTLPTSVRCSLRIFHTDNPIIDVVVVYDVGLSARKSSVESPRLALTPWKLKFFSILPFPLIHSQWLVFYTHIYFIHIHHYRTKSVYMNNIFFSPILSCVCALKYRAIPLAPSDICGCYHWTNLQTHKLLPFFISDRTRARPQRESLSSHDEPWKKCQQHTTTIAMSRRRINELNIVSFIYTAVKNGAELGLHRTCARIYTIRCMLHI